MTGSPLCRACGRPIERTSKDGSPLSYCSRRCRSQRVRPADRALERGILDLLEARETTATICPSEVVRRLHPDDWRARMEDVRRAGRRLAMRDEIEFLQHGRVVDPATVRGPIRLRLCRRENV